MMSGPSGKHGKVAQAPARWPAAIGAFALLWAAETFLVQHVTVVPSYTHVSYHLKLATRFALNLSLITACAISFRPILLAAVSGLAVVWNLGLLTYAGYFRQTLTMSVVVSNWGEGIQVADFAVSLVPWPWVLILGLSLLVKLLLLRAAGRPGFSLKLRVAGSLCCLAFYATVMLALGRTPARLTQIRRAASSADLMVTYGYLPPWLAELAYLDDDVMLRRALERRGLCSDKLTPLEPSLPLPERLVVVQVESLGFAILGYRANGKEVTPFLNRLHERSMFYRIRASHRIGSADADFAMLMGAEPSRDMNTYKIRRYPYEDALPELLRRLGYEAVALHGASGRFYARRGPFEEMGFSRLVFEEEFNREFGMPSGTFGVYDRDLFDLSARLLRAADRKVFHFLITLTSHGPYHMEPGEGEIFPSPANDGQRYFNTMRYVDDQLRAYFRRLPAETLVIIYGDHTVGVKYGDFVPDRHGANDYVPCFIHLTGGNLALRQKTRDLSLARDGRLSLLDVATYLRRRLVEEHHTPAAALVAGAPRSETGKTLR